MPKLRFSSLAILLLLLVALILPRLALAAGETCDLAAGQNPVTCCKAPISIDGGCLVNPDFGKPTAWIGPFENQGDCLVPSTETPKSNGCESAANTKFSCASNQCSSPTAGEGSGNQATCLASQVNLGGTDPCRDIISVVRDGATTPKIFAGTTPQKTVASFCIVDGKPDAVGNTGLNVGDTISIPTAGGIVYATISAITDNSGADDINCPSANDDIITTNLSSNTTTVDSGGMVSKVNPYKPFRNNILGRLVYVPDNSDCDTGEVPVWNGTGFACAGTSLWSKRGTDIYSSLPGNVGIGTGSGTTPGATLDVNGGAFLGYETSISNLGAQLSSGFYQAYESGSAVTGEPPDTTHSWYHLITSRGSEASKNYQLQIGSSYAENDRLFFRNAETASNNSPDNRAWNEVATRNIGNIFTGNQTITGNLGIGAAADYAVHANGLILADSIMACGGVTSGACAMLRNSTSSGVNNLRGTTYFGGDTGVWNSSNNVGIGTPSPGAKLDVAGNVKSDGEVEISGTYPQIHFEDTERYNTDTCVSSEGCFPHKDWWIRANTDQLQFIGDNNDNGSTTGDPQPLVLGNGFASINGTLDVTGWFKNIKFNSDSTIIFHGTNSTYLTPEVEPAGFALKAGGMGADLITQHDPNAGWAGGLLVTDIHAGKTGTVPNRFVFLRGDGVIENWGELSSSDERLKKDIRPIGPTLEKVEQLRAVTFQWKNDSEIGIQYGLIAQEVEKIFPEMVNTAETGDHLKTISYNQLTPILIEAIKEQQKLIEDRQKTIDNLFSSLAEFERGIHDFQNPLAQ